MEVYDYRFVRRYLERNLQPALSLRQVDPLIRQLTHVLNRLIVQRRNGANPGSTNQALGANGALVVGQIPQINTLILHVPEQAADPVAAALQRSGEFTFVEKDFIARINTTTPNDPYFSSQWHLPQISAPTAWDTTTGSTAPSLLALSIPVPISRGTYRRLCGSAWNKFSLPGEIDQSSWIYSGAPRRSPAPCQRFVTAIGEARSRPPKVKCWRTFYLPNPTSW
jgi:hypothetical protein